MNKRKGLQWHHSKDNGKYEQRKVSTKERSEAETPVSSADELEQMQGVMQDDNQGEEVRFAQFLDSDENPDSDEDLDSERSDPDQRVGEEEVVKDASTTIDFSGRKKDDEFSLRKQMESIPFSTLAKAKRAMRQEKELDDEEEEVFSGSEIDQFEADRKLMSERQEEREQQLIEKRQSKHAPTELSSRRPVSRKRSVVETSSTEKRDPRFSSLSASMTNKGLFRSSYGFLRDQQSDEIRELQAALSKLKRQEKNQAGPKATSEFAQRLRQERERIEQALRREEGRENERQRRERKDEVMRNARKAIDERVQKGGKRYYLKESEKKKLILQDKFEQLANGQRSTNSSSSAKKNNLQKAVERRRKKNSAKDRQMPLGGGFGATESFFDGSMQVPKRKRMRKESMQ